MIDLDEARRVTEQAAIQVAGLRKIASSVRPTPGDDTKTILISTERVDGAPGAWVEALTHVFAAVEAQGFKLVPVVATEEMLQAFYDNEWMEQKPRPAEIWRDMLTASGAK